MPRQRDETEQEWMDRIRAQRGLPPLDANRMMERTRAAVGYIGTTRGNTEALKMAAFLSIFHPEIEGREHLELMQDAKARDAR